MKLYYHTRDIRFTGILEINGKQEVRSVGLEASRIYKMH